MKEFLVAIIKRLNEKREFERKLQKRLSGNDSEGLISMSMGKMMAYDNCLKELERLLGELNSMNDDYSLF